MDHAHAATAAARARLDEHGVADFAGNAKNFLRIIGQSTVAAGNAGNARIDHRLFGVDLVAHQTDGCRSRADKRQTGLRDALGKIRILGQEAEARMNGLTAGSQRRRNDIIHIQVAVRRTGRTDADRFVRDLRVQRFAVSLGVNGHRDNA